MASPEHLAILKKGVKAWNQWRVKHPEVNRPDLNGATLIEAYLGGANLSGARLSGADLSVADLSRAELTGADLSRAELGYADLTTARFIEADLSGAGLRAADLSYSNLSYANLSGADLGFANLSYANLSYAGLIKANLRYAGLGYADLSRTDLSEAELSQALLGYTIFADVDLSSVKGLETVIHKGPSSIGIDTIYRSKGRIPRVFLRGAGVPENFIEYMASLVGSGIEFYSLFISYSTNDQAFADRLYADLQAKDVRCWFAPHDMRSGRKVHEQIDAAIRMHDKMLLILSEHSMNSEWVKTEISKARKREVRDGKRVLFPIRLCTFETLRDWECFDADTGKDSAREIREYFIPDFSNWKDHDAYKLAFDRLLKDLQGKTAPLITP
jgi:uncharacterized protein YjbI with pentapeptide repeats